MNRFGDLEHYPWEFGLAALGNRLVHNKRVSRPIAVGIGASLPPQLDLEAVHVQNYAREHPDEDVEVSAEAGEIMKPLPEPPESAELPSSTLSSDQPAAHGQKRSDETEHGDAPKRVKFADAGFSALERTFLLDDSATGESAPKTPKLDEDTKQKSLNQVTSTDLSLYEHEDDPVSFAFNNDELDELEEYELNFSNDELYDSQELNNDELTKQLMFPFSKREPNLTPEELQRLDAIADMMEVKRLKSMQVLTDTTEMPTDHKVLSTRFVRTCE